MSVGNSRRPSHTGVSPWLTRTCYRPILFGAAFYDEYRVNGDLERDLDLMAEASFRSFAWASRCGRRGSRSRAYRPRVAAARARRRARPRHPVLGTPTYAVPPWLRAMDPDLAGEERHRGAPGLGAGARRSTSRIPCSGSTRRAHPGHRREKRRPPRDHRLPGRQRARRRSYCTTSAFRRVPELARRPLRGRRDAQPRVGAHVLVPSDPSGTSSGVPTATTRRNTSSSGVDTRPSRRRFIAWQAGSCGSTRIPAVRHDLHLVRAAGDRRQQLVHGLDVTAGNPYYRMQEASTSGSRCREPRRGGRPGYGHSTSRPTACSARHRLRFWSPRRTRSPSEGPTGRITRRIPVRSRLAGLALVARGAPMIEYWQWQTLHYGIETYWGGVLPHSGRPVASTARSRSSVSRSETSAPPSRVHARRRRRPGLLDRYEGGFEFYPPLADAGRPDRRVIPRIFDPFYRGAHRGGRRRAASCTRASSGCTTRTPSSPGTRC